MTTRKERRRSPRVPAIRGINLAAEVRVGQDRSLSAKVVNLSRHGTLLEMSDRLSPRVRVDEKVSVKLRLNRDVVWLAGIVRHCYAARLGVHFPERTGGALTDTNHILTRILRDAKQGKARRRAVSDCRS